MSRLLENPKPPKLTIVVKKQISYLELMYLLSNAFDGGSAYWAKIDGMFGPEIPPLWVQRDDGLGGWDRLYWLPFTDTGEVIIAEKDDDDDDWGGPPLNPRQLTAGNVARPAYSLNIQTITKGLQIMADQYPRHFNNFLDDNADAETGDVFLQCCLFGKLVYG
jgi:hypothetical protein